MVFPVKTFQDVTGQPLIEIGAAYAHGLTGGIGTYDKLGRLLTTLTVNQRGDGLVIVYDRFGRGEGVLEPQ